jgi:hypothetical protein
MSAKGKHLTRRWLVSGATALTVALAVVGAIRHDDFQSDAQSSGQQASSSHRSGASTLPRGASGASTGPCGAASAATIASVDMKVARRIYEGELRGGQVSADIAHITGDRELLSALASSDEATVGARVHTIVYTPHWHIVRLRVAKNGRVLADVGGPEIIAPVSGPLRWQGRKVGSFVMSVQDDIGYVKLVSRFIGVPVDLYREGSFLTGTLQPAPPSASAGQSVTVAGRTYEAHVLDTLAFPTGTLQAALFVPKPPSAKARRSCAALKIAAWGDIAKHVAARFSPLSAHYSDLAGTLKGATAGLVYVRAGTKQLAGGARPARIPHGGTVSYHGRSWSVFSWEPVPPARVYLLVPAG